MIGGLGPYPEMRRSEVPWLGDVPTHWDVRRIKTLLKEVDVRTKTGEEQLLSLRMRQGLVDHIEAGGKPIPAESLINFKIATPGQVVMNRMRAAAGLFGVANVRGLVSPDYAVFDPEPEAFTPYLLQAFKLPALSGVFRAESKGLGTGESGFLRLYTDRFGPIRIPYPPLEEQRLIVRFLDWHGARTAKLIRAKKKLIALLNEQKQAVIRHAVTRGLDPNIKLNPSGIPWLGDVPAHWEVKRLKNEMSFLGGSTPSKAEAAYWNGNIPWVSPKDMKVDVVNNAADKITTEAVSQSSTKIVPAGSILMVVRSGILQRTIPIALCECDVALNQDMKALISKGKLVPAYFVQYVRGCEQMLLATWTKQGATVESIEHQLLVDSLIPVPPPDEQNRILEAIGQNCHKYYFMLAKLQREIALIQEFRTRLIADVVTGKLDVRAAASKLPEVSELEPIVDPSDAELEDMMDESEDEEAAA